MMTFMTTPDAEDVVAMRGCGVVAATTGEDGELGFWLGFWHWFWEMLVTEGSGGLQVSDRAAGRPEVQVGRRFRRPRR
jgi:hypothetical protein